MRAIGDPACSHHGCETELNPCIIRHPPWRRTRLGFMCLASIPYVFAYSLGREMKSEAINTETFYHAIETAQPGIMQPERCTSYCVENYLVSGSIEIYPWLLYGRARV